MILSPGFKPKSVFYTKSVRSPYFILNVMPRNIMNTNGGTKN